MKRGYHLLQSPQDGTRSSMDKEVWRRLLRLILPPKVLNFFWWACEGLLPTMEALATKHVTENRCCPVCTTDVESVLHALVSCPLSSRIWLISEVNIGQPLTSGFAGWWSSMSSVKEDVMQWIGTICWRIWNQKNSVMWRNICRNKDQVIE